MLLPSKLGIQLKYFIVFLLTIAMVTAALLSGMRTLKVQQLRNEAMSIAEQVVSFRTWVSNNGVVWVDHLSTNSQDFLGERKTEAGAFFSKNPALATRELSEIVSKSSSRATFRVTSSNYRNPKNAPDAFESSAIQHLEQDGGQKYTETFKDGAYRYAQPIYVQKPCLKCHGDPADAPKEVIDKYGSKMGFGYKEGMIRGIISVTLPDMTLWETMKTLINPYSIGLLLCAFLLNFFFTQLALIRRLRKLAVITEDIAKGEMQLEPPVSESLRDEVDQVAHSINLLRTSLVVAMEHLRKKKKEA